MNAEELFSYRSAAKAVEVVDKALKTMKLGDVLRALDVAESTLRSWRSHKGSAVGAATARKLRRLERRLAS